LFAATASNASSTRPTWCNRMRAGGVAAQDRLHHRLS
jgi:hypothetical protein